MGFRTCRVLPQIQFRFLLPCSQHLLWATNTETFKILRTPNKTRNRVHIIKRVPFLKSKKASYSFCTSGILGRNWPALKLILTGHLTLTGPGSHCVHGHRCTYIHRTNTYSTRKTILKKVWMRGRNIGNKCCFFSLLSSQSSMQLSQFLLCIWTCFQMTLNNLVLAL